MAQNKGCWKNWMIVVPCGRGTISFCITSSTALAILTMNSSASLRGFTCASRAACSRTSSALSPSIHRLTLSSTLIFGHRSRVLALRYGSFR